MSRKSLEKSFEKALSATKKSTRTQKAKQNKFKIGDRVEAGYGDDHDTGIILGFNEPGIALIAWDSGQRTPCLTADLSLTTERSSGGSTTYGVAQNALGVTMRLLHFPANSAWAFVFGDTPTSVGDKTFFQTRKEAVHAANFRGLNVSAKGIVSVQGDNPYDKKSAYGVGTQSLKVRPPTKWMQIYVVQGNYGQGWEDLTTSLDAKEAKQTLKEYRENDNYGTHRRITRRVLRSDYTSVQGNNPNDKKSTYGSPKPASNIVSLADKAAAALGIDIEIRNGRAYHYADETRSWWRLTAEDLQSARQYAKEYPGDAYSHWCAGTSARELSQEAAERLGL